ncbi:transposable element gene [Prunus dulcis]|uniref:Transposable element protein n=1 Tax=Prunus dulcis TaxID=3755 RepID=A0A4Y1S004_PRUDU|nr:transposable element gene [Prunus dulcis]
MDAYATLEEDRLDYIRKNKKNLRSEVYKGIYDAISKGDNDANNIGQRVILPSSYTGSARYMLNNYQDAMTICRQYGNPDLFITFTCNGHIRTLPFYAEQLLRVLTHVTFTYMFKVSLVLEDSTDETNAIIIGRPAEQLFRISCNELVVQRDAILQTRGQVKKFQLRFGSMRSDFNRNDLLIQAIFDDTMPLLEPTSQSSDKSLAAHDTENIGTQMVPPITPLLSKQIPSASSTSSADASITEATPISKKDTEDAVKRALFTFRPSKKPKSISLSHVQIENEFEKMVATKSMKEIVSDSDLPIIGLNEKFNGNFNRMGHIG